MVKTPEYGKESLHSAHAKGINVYSIFTALEYFPKI